MRYSKLFGKTVREANSDATLVSHKLLYKAGFIRESTAGRYFFLPLGIRVQDKVMKVIEDAMNDAGAQKMITPVLHPLELWKETNRTNTTGFELMKVKDRRGAEFALGGTAEEMFVDVVRNMHLSYKDLPINLYQFSTKFRDELRARGGLLRVREFVMKDAYSFHTSEEDFRKEYEKMADTYTKIFNTLGLKTFKIESDNGYIGGEYCHEFVVESEIGESKYLVNESGDYAAHEEVAKFDRDNKNVDEKEKELKEVDAKRGNTMEDGVEFHKLPLWQQLKDVMFVDENGRFVLALLRGDYSVNETSLKHLIKANDLRPATDDEIRSVLHSEPGFISPVGIKEGKEPIVGLVIVADISLRTVKNFYGGSNKKNKDLLNVNIDRDFKADLEGEIALAEDGFMYKGSKLTVKKGIEVGNIFQLGYHYSSLMKGAQFVDNDGTLKNYYMGCYGIGLGRTLATIVEVHNDEKGIIWPSVVAPYNVHVVGLDKDLEKEVESLVKELEKNDIEVLWDDRSDVSAGQKFADADLIGIPVRLVLSKKSKEKGGVELKERGKSEVEIIKIGDVVSKVKSLLSK
ncbi:MAG TPA: proline--tRNA ligase [Candidatus Dojkabacteria bacterium]|nr:proline--tRNA ligase [Candidatus Dojkabacteria bacterium]